MKKYTFAAFVLPLLLVPACQKEISHDLTPEAPATSKHTVTIHASFGEDATKTLFSLDGAGNYHTAWETGDVIAIQEHVTGVSSDPELYEIDSYSSWTTSDPLTTGGETAVFTAAFASYYWESTLTDEQKATYTFSYTYLATTLPSYGVYVQSDAKGDYIPFMMPTRQTIYASGFSTEDDVLVSRTTDPSATRPSEISFNFARLGTIVEITLSGLQEGDVVKSGSWYTGDTFVPGLALEHCIAYYPDLQEYVKLLDFGEMLWVAPEHRIDFSSASSPSIAADVEGKAKIYLRCLPGQMDDWFGLICTVDRGGSEVVLSKEVSLKDLGRGLRFKDGGLTKFSVSLLPAQAANPSDIMYIVPEPRDGFLAYWPAGEHVSGYKCYYERQTGYDPDVFETVTLTPAAGTGEMAGLYYVEVTDGLAADEYTLYVKAVPDAESGSTDFSYYNKTLYVNVPIEFRWPDVSSYSAQPELYKLSDGLWRITEIGDTYNPWYFEVSNVYTDWGYVQGKDNSQVWSIRTKTDSSFQHQGRIAHIGLKIGNTLSNVLTVKGIAADGTETLIVQPEARYWSSSENYYDYDFSGGNYNGFSIECGLEPSKNKSISVTMLSVYYYAPTGE